MIKRYVLLILATLMILFTSGCAMLNTALAAGAAYGISQLFD